MKKRKKPRILLNEKDAIEERSMAKANEVSKKDKLQTSKVKKVTKKLFDENSESPYLSHH